MKFTSPVKPFAYPMVRPLVAQGAIQIPPPPPPPPPPGLDTPAASFTGTMAVTEDDDYTYYRLTSDGDLSFDADGSVEVELVGGGGGGGGTLQGSGGGGGGAGLRATAMQAVAASTAYPVVIGSGGGSGVVGTRGSTGGTTAALGLSAHGGGGGGSKSSGGGGNGACGGGCHSSTDIDNHEGNEFSLGDLGGGGGGGAYKKGGGGGGMGGDADPKQAVSASPSFGGPGLPSLLPGVTVCAGGDGGQKIVVRDGADGVNPGDGGEGAGATNTTAYIGGVGAAGHVVIRVPKAGSATHISVDEATLRNDAVGWYRQDPIGFGFGLNAACTAAEVPITGTHAGESDTLQARVLDGDDTVIVDWTDLGAVSGGAFSFRITVPASTLLHRAEVRLKNRTGVFYRQRILWRTAIVVAQDGQSNTNKTRSMQDNTRGGTEFWPENAFYVNGGYAYNEAIATGGAPGYPKLTATGAITGQGQTQLYRELVNATGLPVMGIGVGQGATNSNILSQPTSSSYINLMTAAKKIGHVHIFDWHQGESDTGRSAESYAENVNKIRDAIEAATGQATGSLVSIASSLATNLDTDAADWALQKSTQKDYLPANLLNWHFAGAWDDAVRSDSVHCDWASYERRCAREGRLAAHLLGFATDPGVFRIANAVATSATTTTVTLAHNNLASDFEFVGCEHYDDGSGYPGQVTPGLTSVNSFEVTAGADWTGPITPTTAVRTDANTITLTHTDIGTGPRRLRYSWGPRPGNGADGSAPTQVVRSADGTYNWPLEYENDLAVS